MSEDCNCEECENGTTEFIMTILEGLTFICAIFVTVLYTWEFYDKYNKKKVKNRRRGSSCLPRIRSNNSIHESDELQSVFEDD